MTEYSDYPDFIKHRCELCEGEALTVSIEELSSTAPWKSQWDFLRALQEAKDNCALHHFALACMSWINETLPEDDSVLELQITRDGRAQVLSTKRGPEAKHLIFECLQAHSRCSHTSAHISANGHKR